MFSEIDWMALPKTISPAATVFLCVCVLKASLISLLSMLFSYWTDFVLVWEEPLSSQEEERKGLGLTHKKWRMAFLNKLRDSGLLQETVKVLEVKTKICFVLLSAPWNVLCYYAEEITLRVPLQVVTAPSTNWSARVLSRLSLPNPMSQDVPNPPLDFHTCQFRNNKLQRRSGTFRGPAGRQVVLYEILARTPYGSVTRGEVGIDRLLSEQVFTAGYPLHEGGFNMPTPPVPLKSWDLREILYFYWATWSSWRHYQPLDHIREYFGEKIALYFAWLGFYTGWLLPASLVGTVVFLFGFWLMATDVPAKELCDSGNSFPMCSLCHICSDWNYSSICLTYKAGILFDNGGTVFFSVFMSLWAVTFLEYWKRTCLFLSHRWDCSEFQDIEERPRPEFTAMAPMTMKSPVTGAEEPYFPEKQRLNRTMTGCMVIILMVVVVLVFLMAIILYRSILTVFIYKSGGFLTGWVSSTRLLVLCCVVPSEMHRTQSKYEDMFILKVFIFQFINFYSTPIYIAFFKGRFIGYPGNYQTLFGFRNEECGPGGCLIELAQELLVIMVGKQLINNTQEFFGEEERREDKQEEEQGDSPWEADYQLLVYEGLFSEYLEMVIQFGFITIFVAACPLAPLFALINNWVEIRLDAQKFVTEYRRPVAERAQDIGIWFPILQFISHIAVLTNAFLIAFTSSFLPRLYYGYTRDETLTGYINFTLATSPGNYRQTQPPCRYRSFRNADGDYLPEYFHLLAIQMAFVIVFEHVVFSIGLLIDLVVPDVPEEVELKMKREHYMAKQALAENQSLGISLFPGEKEVPSKVL
uniref:Anoctamin n=1 Tax=Cyclopterus lumpus TaxID=8103 RepID=A0A8C2X472_CYCLU